MAAPKRSLAQRESDMNRLAEMYVMGKPQHEIAKALSISQCQVSQDLKKLLKRWEEDQTTKINVYKEQQLIRINKMEQEFWEQWEKSKTIPKQVTTKSHSGKASMPQPEFARVSTTEEAPMGNMAYMQGIMWCVAERNKILGLYAPKKIAATNPTGDKEAGGVDKVGELMDMINTVADRLRKAPEMPTFEAEGEIIDVDEEGNVIENVEKVKHPSKAAELLKQIQIKRLPPPSKPTVTVPSPVFHDDDEDPEDMAKRLAEQLDDEKEYVN